MNAAHILRCESGAALRVLTRARGKPSARIIRDHLLAQDFSIYQLMAHDHRTASQGQMEHDLLETSERP